MKSLFFVAGIMAASAAYAETPTLTVYTYDSFVSDWGPGPAVEKAFEAQCGCDLEFVGAGDGAELLARLRLEGARTKADVVLGLDSNLIFAARKTGLFTEHGVDPSGFTAAIDWTDELFLPFDWGFFAFVYNIEKISNPPESFADLIASDLKIIIQDPRSSTPGLGLLLWVKSVFGDDSAKAWAGLSERIVTVTKGWSEAYGLFLDGESDMVLSYTTSPLYHLIAEEDASYAAALFSGGHYMQIEVAGRIATSDQPELADQFMAFIKSDAFQEIIPTTNWMYPAFLPVAKWPEAFSAQVQPETTLFFDSREAYEIREAAIAEWLNVMSN